MREQFPGVRRSRPSTRYVHGHLDTGRVYKTGYPRLSPRSISVRRMRSASLLRVPKALRALSEGRGPGGSPRRICENRMGDRRLNLPRLSQRARALRIEIGSAPTLRVTHTTDWRACGATVITGPWACRVEVEHPICPPPRSRTGADVRFRRRHYPRQAAWLTHRQIAAAIVSPAL